MDTTIEALTSEIRAFRDARDWVQFHNPKELAVAGAMRAKLARNEERYPADRARGSNAKYDEL